MIISIDPGLTGAVAVFRNGELKEVFDIPITAKTNGKGKQVNASLLASMIAETCNLQMYKIEKAVIERVHAMPGQGVTSVFGFGRTLGVIEGILATFKISVEWTTPQKWKKQQGIIGKDKDAARTLVIEKYPNNVDLFKRKKDIGRADAVLIGLSYIELCEHS